MAMRVPVSFKENEREIYDYIIKQLSPSIYIKELIIKDMENKKVSQKKKTTNSFDF